MDVSDIRLSYDYMFWAHERLWPTVAELAEEEFTRDLGSSHPSVRDTLVHLMSAEWIWLSRWHGVSPHAMLDPTAFPTAAALEDRWRGIRGEMRRFLGQVRDEDLPRSLAYRNIRGQDITLPLVASLQHVVNHDTYHRGQVVTLLRQLGRTPLGTDLFLFYLEDEGRLQRMYGDWEMAPSTAPRDDDDEEEK